MSVNVSAQFTKETRTYNGLLAIEDELVKDPHAEHFIVAKIVTKSITEDVENGGVKTPTIQLVQVEALDGEAAATAKELLVAAFKARTGGDVAPQEPLPVGDDGAATERPADEWLDDTTPPSTKKRGR